MNVSASDDSSDDYANISVVGGIVVGCSGAKNNTKSQHSRLNTDLMSERFIIQIFFAISAFFTKT